MFQLKKCGIEVVPTDSSPKEFDAVIEGPPETPYEGGKFTVGVSIPNNFPFSPPVVMFTQLIQEIIEMSVWSLIHCNMSFFLFVHCRFSSKPPFGTQMCRQ